MDDSMSQVTALIAAGATVSHIMEWLKQARWFPFLSRTSTTTNKWIAVIAAWGTGVGFGLNTHDYSFAAGGVIHVTIPMASLVIDSLKHAIIQWIGQEGYYRVMVKPKQAPAVAAPLGPAEGGN